MKAIATNVLLLRAKRKTEHRGIIIPDLAQKESWYGKAFTVGPDVTAVKEGDVVMFDPGLATPVLADQIDTALCVVAREDAILAVLQSGELEALGFSEEFDDPFDVLAAKVPVASNGPA